MDESTLATERVIWRVAQRRVKSWGCQSGRIHLKSADWPPRDIKPTWRQFYSLATSQHSAQVATSGHFKESDKLKLKLKLHWSGFEPGSPVWKTNTLPTELLKQLWGKSPIFHALKSPHKLKYNLKLYWGGIWTHDAEHGLLAPYPYAIAALKEKGLFLHALNATQEQNGKILKLLWFNMFNLMY